MMGIIHSIVLLFIFTAFVINNHGSQIPNYDSSFDDFQQKEESIETDYEENASVRHEIPNENHENNHHLESSKAPSKKTHKNH